MAAIHASTSKTMGRRNGFTLVGAVRLVIILAIAAAVIAAGVVGGRSLLAARRLPTFDGTRPTYGHVTMRFDERTDGERTTGMVRANGDGSQLSFATDPGQADPVELIVVGSDVYALDGGTWYLNTIAPTDLAGFEWLTRVPMFSDFVPGAMRPHAHVESRRDVEIDGRELTRYEVRIDMDAFERTSPTEHAAYVESAGVDEGSSDGQARLVLTVDSTGVVWRVESWSDFDDDRIQYDLVEYGDDVYLPDVPADVVDLR